MSFEAKYKGACANCGEVIWPGQQVNGRYQRYVHAECPDPSDSGCLVCGKACKHLRVDAIHGITGFANEDGFMIDFERGCPPGCECDGRNYHVMDFCSEDCLYDAVKLYHDEEKKNAASGANAVSDKKENS